MFFMQHYLDYRIEVRKMARHGMSNGTGHTSGRSRGDGGCSRLSAKARSIVLNNSHTVQKSLSIFRARVYLSNLRFASNAFQTPLAFPFPISPFRSSHVIISYFLKAGRFLLTGIPTKRKSRSTTQYSSENMERSRPLQYVDNYT
jgi:hypothetical protein